MLVAADVHTRRNSFGQTVVRSDKFALSHVKINMMRSDKFALSHVKINMLWCFAVSPCGKLTKVRPLLSHDRIALNISGALLYLSCGKLTEIRPLFLHDRITLNISAALLYLSVWKAYRDSAPLPARP
ncbi:hypothetical protein J6590_080836 [Homalodisca vitripennis]|nr:hypothetical protein J6590_080836 [Homalodisca vitripennis]